MKISLMEFNNFQKDLKIKKKIVSQQ
jgi:hypothetical protein